MASCFLPVSLRKYSLLDTPRPPLGWWDREILQVGFFRMLHCGGRGGGIRMCLLLRPPQS